MDKLKKIIYSFILYFPIVINKTINNNWLEYNDIKL